MKINTNEETLTYTRYPFGHPDEDLFTVTKSWQIGFDHYSLTLSVRAGIDMTKETKLRELHEDYKEKEKSLFEFLTAAEVISSDW